MTTTTPYPFETNSLADSGLAHADTVGSLPWSSADLASITRIRLLSDSLHPFWDISYVLGTNRAGEQVRVTLPSVVLRKRQPLADLVAAARADGVFLKGLCGGDIGAVISKLW